MKVALHVGQLRQPVPGGAGTYVRSLLRSLPAAGVTLSTFGSGPADPTWPEFVDLGHPKPPLRYALWHRVRRPRVAPSVDIVHAPTLAVPPTGRVPLVVTAHDVAFLRFPDAFTRHGVRFHRRGLALARRHAAAVIAPSAFTCAELIAEGFEPTRVFVAHHGAPTVPPRSDDEVDAIVAALGLPTPFVLSVGTIEPRKGLRSLFSAFAELRLRGITLVVAGPRGWGEVSVPPDVVELGAVDPHTLDALYRRASAFALASRYEGFGMPALEAMAYGVPVVVSNVASLPEVVGQAGLLVPPGDEDAWADAIASVVTDEERGMRLGSAGRERAAEFTWERSATAHLEAYEAATSTAP